ncbi:MAG: PAS domain S-box protein [Gemmatimonadaceae bacterium]
MSQGLLLMVRRLAGSAIAALAAIVITVGLMTFLTWQSAHWVRHTRTVQFTAARALDLSLGRRSSIEEYLITGDSATRANETHARSALQLVLDSLTTLTADNATQQAQLLRISAAVRKWDGTYADRVLLAHSSDARSQIGREEGAGVAAFASVRAGLDAFLAEESALYRARTTRNTIWRWTEVVVVALEAMLVFVLLARMRAAVLAQAAATLEHQEQLEDQAVELEAQAAEQEMLTAELQVANTELTDAAVEQEALTADLEVANQELTEATTEAEEARDHAVLMEDRYRLLFDRNPVPMWVYDEDTLRFLTVNEAAVHQYGYTHSEFMSMGIEDIRSAGDVELLRQTARTKRGELRVSTEWRHRRKDGSEILVDIVSHGVHFEERDARIVLATDVTARAAAAAALLESNEILHAVVDDSPLAIVLSSPELVISRWNKAAETQFGWAASEAVGQSLFMIIPEERRVESSDFRRRLENGEAITSIATQRLRSDGSIRDVQISKCALRSSDGTLTGFVSIISDETDRKQLESQFRQAQKMEAVGQLAGGVAHDFNNLLTVIISYSQMLLADISEESPLRTDVQEIRRAAERAALLTKQLLAFSRQQVLRVHIVDLNQVLGDVEQMLRRLLREDIQILLTLDPELGTVAADRGQLEQIVINLAVNARDAMPSGGRLSIETKNVTFESPFALRSSEPPLEAGSYVMMSVADNGLGMTPEIQARVFEPFFTTKSVHEGTGLGLSTVYGIVKQSRGHLAMYSEPGQGTIFKIYLPRADSSADLRPVAEAATPSSRGGETVLVVEDDAALRTVACRSLRQCGYIVLEAANGQDALRQCEEHEETLELAITDMVMPQMSGVELAESIASSYPGIRVLLMSGYTRDEAARRGIANERYAFLEKPFTPARLAARVREILDAGKSRAHVMERIQA